MSARVGPPGEVVRKGSHALVLGSGIGGLSSALVLANHFERVTVIERDEMPDQPRLRPHTPQGAHAHLLLARGLLVFSRLIPELGAWLDDLGLPEGDLTYHARVAYRGKWIPKVRSNIAIRTCTRPVVEHLLERAVRGLANVDRLDRCTVEGLLGTDQIRGVQATRDGVTQTIDADLVVDAMGRGSPSPRWLAERGKVVPEHVVDAGVVYTSCWLETPAIDDDWTALAPLPAAPDDPHMGIMIRTEPTRILCSVVGYGKPTPPRTHAELIACTTKLSVPEMAQIVKASKPSSDLITFANTRNRRRLYGQVPAFPDGLVILGDAACSLNPRYGQGMTIAAMAVEQLDMSLTEHFAKHGHLRGFSRHFQVRAERQNNVAWQIALMEDRLWESLFTKRAPGLLTGLVVRASGRVLDAAMSDIDTYIRFMRVAQMLDSPLAMLRPRTLASIARGGHAEALVRGPGICE